MDDTSENILFIYGRIDALQKLSFLFMSYHTVFIQINIVVFKDGSRMYAFGINLSQIKSVVDSTLTQVSQLCCLVLLSITKIRIIHRPNMSSRVYILFE